MSDLAYAWPSSVIFRLARAPDPWAWPPWEYCKKANRWDDPTDNYRVLYASTQRLGTFVETLARFRPDPAVIAGLAAITGDDDGALPAGHVPASWIANRTMGTAKMNGPFADVGQSESLAHLQIAMAPELVRYSIKELDGSVIRQAPRQFTQEVSRYVFGRAHPDGTSIFEGITYQSRLGDEFMNWAIFERHDREPVREPCASAFRVDDADFLEVLELFKLTLRQDR